ncbi:hypothetical protein EV426DRAFT_665886 [Tirmania nivea]|nr:hypothetical protein EV426DRAFT_665886 [Tirmania nivea]
MDDIPYRAYGVRAVTVDRDNVTTLKYAHSSIVQRGAVEVGEVRLYRIPLVLLLSFLFSPYWYVQILPCPGVPDELLALLAVVGTVEGDVIAVLRLVVAVAATWGVDRADEMEPVLLGAPVGAQPGIGRQGVSVA